MFERIRTWWRLSGGFCPKCNSSMPGIDDCVVCIGGRLCGKGDRPILRDRYVKWRDGSFVR